MLTPYTLFLLLLIMIQPHADSNRSIDVDFIASRAVPIMSA
jgi:hypothetical protein